MVKTTYRAKAADIDELFRANGFTLAPMEYAEADAYDGTLTLSDSEEHDGDAMTTLWIREDGYTVEVVGDGDDGVARTFDDLGTALEEYWKMTLEHGTNATRVIM